MAKKNAKCIVCGGEQEVESNDAIRICEYCGNIIKNTEGIRNYMNNGSYQKTEDEIKQEAKIIRNQITVKSFSGVVKNDGSGYIEIVGTIINRSAVPIISMRIFYCVIDQNGQKVDGSQINGFWDFDMRNNPLLKDEEFQLSSKEVYLTGKSLHLKEVYVLLVNVIAIYQNNQILVVNPRYTKYIRDDQNLLPDILFVWEKDENANKKKTMPNHNGDKSWMVYAFLGFVFSGWGVHNFYAGNIKRALIQLGLTLTVIGSIVTCPWAIMEVIGAISDKDVPDYSINPKLF